MLGEIYQALIKWGLPTRSAWHLAIFLERTIRGENNETSIGADGELETKRDE